MTGGVVEFSTRADEFAITNPGGRLGTVEKYRTGVIDARPDDDDGSPPVVLRREGPNCLPARP